MNLRACLKKTHARNAARLVARCCALFAALWTVTSLAEEKPAAFEWREGGIIRGPRSEKRIALEFTAHDYGDGGKIILDELARHRAKASFFFTGDFLRNPRFKLLVERVVKEGHYLAPHSDKHLLYCPWSGPKETLVSREVFTADLLQNLAEIEKFGVLRNSVKYWVPPYEHYNEEIVAWSREEGLTVINFTPGTRSTADYTENDAKNFVPSDVIFESILKKEREDPHGLNGFLLLLHFGVSPKRTDKFHHQFGRLLDVLSEKGYAFVRVDELLGAAPPQPEGRPGK